MSEGASVKVAVRVRPFNQREIDKKSKLCIAMPSRETTIINQPETDAPKTFTFDFSYWSHDGFKKDEKTGIAIPDGDTKYASQELVFNDLGKLVLDNAFDGFNCSLFAYGQTGSGKSYSMVGYGADKGIIPLACDKMFSRCTETQKAEPNTSFQVTVTMLEIYNEQVRDLLNTKSLGQKEGLKVREKKGIGVYVDGLVPRPVANYAEIEARMEEGTKNRTIGSTKMNATSSRAHTVFGILFTRKAKDPGSGQEAETTSKINLVDLAGSERADSTGATGDRLKEGCAINQSLSALGNVISTLADNAGNPKNQKFVPYRNSVLTRLLQDALGGNSKTIMIAALSPADVNYDETLSTLRYADRAKKIKNSVIKNENPTDRIIRLLKEENDRLKKLLEGKGVDLNTALAGGGGGGGGDVDAMKKKWEEEKKENDRIIAEMKKSWEEKVKEAQATAKSSGGPDAGTSAVLAKNAAASRLPHIVLLNEDPQLSGNLVYMFKIGTTKIGKRHSDGAAEKQDIELTGLNVLKQHAVVENDAASKVTIEPLNKSRTFVNGELIKAKRELKQGDRILLGNNQHVFKFVNPATPNFKEEDGNISEDEYEKLMKEFSEKQGLNKSSMSAEVQKLEEEEKKTRKELEDKLKTMEDMLRKERESARKEMESVRSVILKKGALSDADKASLQKLEAEFNDKVGKSDAQLKERKEMEAQMLQEQLKRKRENQKVESQLSSLIPLVNEVNQMAEEMQKPVRFEAKLIIKPTATINFSTLDEIQHLKKIDVVVRVHSLANGNVWTWIMEKFENRLFMMRDVYQAFQDFGPQDLGQKDPFWDPPEAIEIGKAYVYLKALSQLVEIENEFAIIDHAGEERGMLRVEINPEGLNGEEKEYLGSSDELVDKSVVFNVKVPFARGLPAKYSNDVHVVFKFNGETCETEHCDEKTTDPKWKFAAKIRLEKVEPKHIKYLLTEACVFEIRGFTDNSKGAAAPAGAGATAAAAGKPAAIAGPVVPANCPICEERPTAVRCTDCEEAKQFYCGTCWPVHHKSAAKKAHKKQDVTPGGGGGAAAAAKDQKTPAPATGAKTTNAALLCDWCSEQRPTVTCVECNSAFCDQCNAVKHKSKTLQAHNRQPFTSPMSGGPMSPGPSAPQQNAPPPAAAAAAAAPAGGGGAGVCQNCEEHPAVIACDGCDGKKFCDTCWAANHKSAAKKAHPKKAL